MLGISFPEFLTIALVGLVIFGPNRLPEVARSSARAIRKVRAFFANAMDSLDEEAKGITDFAADLQSLTPRGIVSQVFAPEVISKSAVPPVRVAREQLSTDFDPDAT